MAIGIGVHSPGSGLAVERIRPPSWQPIVLNSLIETNLGMPSST
jgi:hypothetical protein